MHLMSGEQSRKVSGWITLALLLLILASIPIPTGRHGIVDPVDFAAHPDVVEDISGRWHQLAVTDAPRRALDRVWHRDRPTVTSAELLSTIVPGSDAERSYVEFQRGRLNADALARRILGQQVSVRGIVETAHANLVPGELILDVNGVLVPDSQVVPMWQEEDVLPAGELKVRVSSPDDFTDRLVRTGFTELEGTWSPVVVSAQPLRTPLRNTIGGSAGLVQSLAVLDALEVGDLTGGRRVAATGVIAPDGSIRPIEGAFYKVQAAKEAGMDVVFVPELNRNEAEQVEGVTVVGVRRIEDVLAWLCARGAQSVVCAYGPSQWEAVARDPLIDAFSDPRRVSGK